MRVFQAEGKQWQRPFGGREIGELGGLRRLMGGIWITRMYQSGSSRETKLIGYVQICTLYIPIGYVQICMCVQHILTYTYRGIGSHDYGG